ncbi:MAG: arginine repressor [Clostridia bacterium]|nr:arginine repressor [Clostridia bacterium]
MLREERQAKILEIIAKQEIETQEELCNALNQANYSVTQATVSRDIKSLHLFKIKGTQKRYRYSHLQQTDDVALPGKLRRLFKESVLSICSAGNLVVIKTLSGSASNAGLALDKLNYSEVVGTVAGDDTLFSACESAEAALMIVEKLNEIIK